MNKFKDRIDFVKIMALNINPKWLGVSKLNKLVLISIK